MLRMRGPGPEDTGLPISRESREPRAESREPRAESREPRAESREPRAAQGETVRLALEQRHPEVCLELPDPMGDRTRRHAELACRPGEALVPRGHLEETHRIEWRPACRLAHRSRPVSRRIVVRSNRCPADHPGPARHRFNRNSGAGTRGHNPLRNATKKLGLTDGPYSPTRCRVLPPMPLPGCHRASHPPPSAAPRPPPGRPGPVPQQRERLLQGERIRRHLLRQRGVAAPVRDERPVMPRLEPHRGASPCHRAPPVRPRHRAVSTPRASARPAPPLATSRLPVSAQRETPPRFPGPPLRAVRRRGTLIRSRVPHRCTIPPRGEKP